MNQYFQQSLAQTGIPEIEVDSDAGALALTGIGLVEHVTKLSYLSTVLDHQQQHAIYENDVARKHGDSMHGAL